MTETTSQISVDPAHCPSPHSFANKLGRLAWQCVSLILFRPSPWFLHGGRRVLLRLFGARIGRGAKIMPSAKIWAPWNLTMGDYATISHGVDVYNVAPVTIGKHATVSQRAFLCTATHDIDDPHMPLQTAPIEVADGAWICAEAFIHPAVTIGVDAVVAARAVVLRAVGPRQLVAGNPARHVRDRRIGADARESVES